MNNKNRTYSVLTLTLFSIIMLFAKVDVNDMNHMSAHMLDSLKQEKIKTELMEAKLDSIRKVEEEIKNAKFAYVYDKFKHYNTNIDTGTVEKFIEVVEYFNLDSTQKLFDICISQICVESGAKQYYSNGDLVVSSGNAIGITQIVPTTAFHYLRNVTGNKYRNVFTDLGGTDYGFIMNYKRYEFINKDKKRIISQEGREKAGKWLENETNNLILWGFIMKHTLDCNNNRINNTLIAYNIGGGGLTEYIKEGNSTWEHEYVVMVMNVKRKFDNLNV
jgi:hypothetical protein